MIYFCCMFNRGRSGTNLNRVRQTNVGKSFLPPGHVKYQAQSNEPQMYRASVYERPIMQHESSHSRPFIPAGSVKYDHIPHESEMYPGEGNRDNSRSPRRDRGRDSSPTIPFIPVGGGYSPKQSSQFEHFSHRNDPRFSQDSLNGQQPRPQTSEYAEKFKEWVIPSKQPLSPYRHASPLSTYQINFSTADWESEQHRAFKATQPAKNIDHIIDKPAGLPSNRLPYRNFDHDMEEFEEQLGAARSQPTPPATSSSNRLSTHATDYQWPPTIQRTVHYPPLVAGAPMPRDPSSESAKWRSEYDAQCQDLREQQQKLQDSSPTAAAGVSTMHRNDHPSLWDRKGKLLSQCCSALGGIRLF